MTLISLYTHSSEKVWAFNLQKSNPSDTENFTECAGKTGRHTEATYTCTHLRRLLTVGSRGRASPWEDGESATVQKSTGWAPSLRKGGT